MTMVITFIAALHRMQQQATETLSNESIKYRSLDISHRLHCPEDIHPLELFVYSPRYPTCFCKSQWVEIIIILRLPCQRLIKI